MRSIFLICLVSFTCVVQAAPAVSRSPRTPAGPAAVVRPAPAQQDEPNPLSEEARARIVQGILDQAAAMEANIEALKAANADQKAINAALVVHADQLVSAATEAWKIAGDARVDVAKVQDKIDSQAGTIAALKVQVAKLRRLLFLIGLLVAVAALQFLPVVPLGWYRYPIAAAAGTSAAAILFAIL